MAQHWKRMNGWNLQDDSLQSDSLQNELIRFTR